MVLVRVLDEHGLVAVVENASLVKRFVKDVYGPRSGRTDGVTVMHLKGGPADSSLKQLLPAGTLLVAIPNVALGLRNGGNGVTTLSVATAIAHHCESQKGSPGATGSSRPPRVKVKRDRSRVYGSIH